TWSAPPGVGAALGHRRLAIIDLSAAGSQPMVSHDGSTALSFNGEVYNFQEIREELDREAPIDWRGHSDTEVILEAMTPRGTDRSVARFNGMFGIAAWNSPEGRLTLIRDRMGVKPLFVARTDRGAVMFASEMRAFTAHPEFGARLNRSALASFFAYGYFPP